LASVRRNGPLIFPMFAVTASEMQQTQRSYAHAREPVRYEDFVEFVRMRAHPQREAQTAPCRTAFSSAVIYRLRSPIANIRPSVTLG